MLSTIRELPGSKDRRIMQAFIFTGALRSPLLAGERYLSWVVK